MVEYGDVLAALILPPDLIDKLRSLTGLNPEQPKVRVLVNEEDPVKANLVDDRIQSLVTEANLLISKQVAEQAGPVPQPPRHRRALQPALPRSELRRPRPAQQPATSSGGAPRAARRRAGAPTTSTG